MLAIMRRHPEHLPPCASNRKNAADLHNPISPELKDRRQPFATKICHTTTYGVLGFLATRDAGRLATRFLPSGSS
jgi:hypothetical protein